MDIIAKALLHEPSSYNNKIINHDKKHNNHENISII